MKTLVAALSVLKNDERVRGLVTARFGEFRLMRGQPCEVLFQELCFCLLTANCSAECCLRLQQGVGDGFLRLSEDELRRCFQEHGYRFPPRAGRIVFARRFCERLPTVLSRLQGEALRSWLVDHIDGFGYKEASHFLRNIGYDEYGIVDSHVLDVLVRYRVIQEPRSLTKRWYLEIEKTLGVLAKKAGVSLAELDLYLWYMETGKVLK